MWHVIDSFFFCVSYFCRKEFSLTSHISFLFSRFHLHLCKQPKLQLFWNLKLLEFHKENIAKSTWEKEWHPTQFTNFFCYKIQEKEPLSWSMCRLHFWGKKKFQRIPCQYAKKGKKQSRFCVPNLPLSVSWAGLTPRIHSTSAVFTKTGLMWTYSLKFQGCGLLWTGLVCVCSKKISKLAVWDHWTPKFKKETCCILAIPSDPIHSPTDHETTMCLKDQLPGTRDGISSVVNCAKMNGCFDHKNASFYLGMLSVKPSEDLWNFVQLYNSGDHSVWTGCLAWTECRLPSRIKCWVLNVKTPPSIQYKWMDLLYFFAFCFVSFFEEKSENF